MKEFVQDFYVETRHALSLPYNAKIQNTKYKTRTPKPKFNTQQFVQQ